MQQYDVFSLGELFKCVFGNRFVNYAEQIPAATLEKIYHTLRTLFQEAEGTIPKGKELAMLRSALVGSARSARDTLAETDSSWAEIADPLIDSTPE